MTTKNWFSSQPIVPLPGYPIFECARFPNAVGCHMVDNLYSTSNGYIRLQREKRDFSILSSVLMPKNCNQRQARCCVGCVGVRGDRCSPLKGINTFLDVLRSFYTEYPWVPGETSQPRRNQLAFWLVYTTYSLSEIPSGPFRADGPAWYVSCPTAGRVHRTVSGSC